MDKMQSSPLHSSLSLTCSTCTPQSMVSCFCHSCRGQDISWYTVHSWGRPSRLCIYRKDTNSNNISNNHFIEIKRILLNKYSNLRIQDSQRPHGLKRESAAAHLLGMWVWILPGAWKCVSCKCCVLSGRGLCVRLITHPEETYWVWCVWVWSWGPPRAVASWEKEKRFQRCWTLCNRL